MEELGSYEALLKGDELGGRIWWLEGHSCALMHHPRVGVWGTTIGEGHTLDGVWELGC